MKRSSVIVASAAALLAPFAAFAQPLSRSADMPPAAAAAFGGFMLMVMAVFGLLALAFFVFWVMMLVDCAKREWPDKNLWLIILIVTFFVGFHWLSALLYYFMVKKNNLGPGAPSMTGPAPQPPTPPAPPAPPAA
jgi:hypothetical protein